jgi:murein L,D-transpeptidase YcbB/YkuD
MSRVAVVFLAVLAAGAGIVARVGAAAQITMDAAILEALARVQKSSAGTTGDDLAVLYRLSGGAPVWIDTTGRPRRAADTAVHVLAASASEGLIPSAYHADALAASLASLYRAGGTPSDAARFDVDLSATMLLYLRHLHFGRIDPRTLGLQLEPRVEHHRIPDVLWRAVEAGDVSTAQTTLAPGFHQYAVLRRALARYRAIEASPDVRTPLLPDVTIRQGAELPDGAALRRWLTALGDLSADIAERDGPYDGVTAEAMARFQMRHGLPADGVIGPATRRALLVPPAWRIRQIEMALERLRWVSDLDESRRLIAVNIPMFRLWAWDRVPSETPPAIDMAVVVGKALNHRTPVFVDSLERVVIRPYWNVPQSIVRAEILPAVTKNPRYLEEHAFEIVDRGDERAVVLSATPENIERLRTGRAQLRQRPGPTNALGLVKFLFPNSANVYMHATPQPELFSRTRRDFSHGCIRVEDPVGLAEWVLKNQTAWPRDAIERAMAGNATRTVELESPIQVVLFYTTAIVATDGTVRFADDLYGQDARLSDVW